MLDSLVRVSRRVGGAADLLAATRVDALRAVPDRDEGSLSQCAALI